MTTESESKLSFQRLELDTLRALVREVLGDRTPTRWHGVSQVEDMMRKLPHDLTSAQTAAVHALAYCEAIYAASQDDDPDAETQQTLDSGVAHTRASEALNLLAECLPERQAAVCHKLVSALRSDRRPVSAKTSPTNWQTRIRDEATRWVNERDAQSKSKVTKQAVSEEMRKFCKNEDIKTDEGTQPTAQYILRHVLNRWKVPT